MATSNSMTKLRMKLRAAAYKSVAAALFVVVILGSVVFGSPYVLVRFWYESFRAFATSLRDLILIKASA